MIRAKAPQPMAAADIEEQSNDLAACAFFDAIVFSSYFIPRGTILISLPPPPSSST
jgi:hypothetical protein